MQRPLALMLLALAVGASGCRRPEPTARTLHWVRGDGPAPAIAGADQFRRAERSVMVGDEIVVFSRQRWGDAEIEGGSLVTIERAGQVEYLRADYALDPREEILFDGRRLARLAARRQSVFGSWLGSRQGKGLKSVSDVDLVLLPRGSGLVPAFRADVLEKNALVTRVWLSAGGALLKKEKVSSDLFDAEAWIYTLANGKSVQEVTLLRMLEGVDVRGLVHEVASQAPLRPSSDSAPWKFVPGDPRFDQVQAYYFLQVGLDFLAQELGFKMPVKVEAETAVGYPEGTGAAFTYNNQIRLGSGDGVSTRSMAQDPSVVIHELGHVVNQVLARLPNQGEGGSLNEAFADYLAATSLGEPKLGLRASFKVPFLRNLENDAALAGRNGGLYHDSLIVSGTLWELRGKLGAPQANRLALRTLSRLGPARALTDFPPALRAAARDFLSAAEMQKLEATLRGRGWGG